jgi:hypothetical protein
MSKYSVLGPAAPLSAHPNDPASAPIYSHFIFLSPRHQRLHEKLAFRMGGGSAPSINHAPTVMNWRVVVGERPGGTHRAAPPRGGTRSAPVGVSSLYIVFPAASRAARNLLTKYPSGHLGRSRGLLGAPGLTVRYPKSSNHRSAKSHRGVRFGDPPPSCRSPTRIIGLFNAGEDKNMEDTVRRPPPRSDFGWQLECKLGV